MTQVFFGAATTPLETDLDANFTELYTRTQLQQSTTTALGIGVTPSAWGGAFIGVQLNGRSSVASDNGNRLWISSDCYNSGTNWVYGSTGGAVSQYMAWNGSHVWFNAAAGTSGNPITFTQAMTLDASANLLLGVSSLGLANANGIMLNTAGGLAYAMHASGTSSGSAYAAFAYNGTLIGSISQSGTTGVAYNTSSDYRLKSSVSPITSSGAFIDALKPCTWTWISDGTTGAGFIAHELQAVSPASVTGAKDATQPVGSLKDAAGAVLHVGIPQPASLGVGQTWTQTGTTPVYQAVEYGSAEVIAMLVAELQAVRARLHAAGL